MRHNGVSTARKYKGKVSPWSFPRFYVNRECLSAIRVRVQTFVTSCLRVTPSFGLAATERTPLKFATHHSTLAAVRGHPTQLPATGGCIPLLSSVAWSEEFYSMPKWDILSDEILLSRPAVKQLRMPPGCSHDRTLKGGGERSRETASDHTIGVRQWLYSAKTQAPTCYDTLDAF